jgi:integrase
MKFLAKQDLAKVFRAAYEARTEKSSLHHMAMLLQFFTGARVSQMLNVRGEDVFEREGKYVILIRAAKRGNEGTYTLHLDVDPAFDMTPLVALAQTKGLSRIFGGLSRQYYNETLVKYFAAAGVNSLYAHSHIFRHSAAMHVFDTTQRIGAVSKFLLHRSPSSAFVYLAENDGSLAQEAMDNLVLA